MNYDIFDTNSIILGLLATCLFAECIILVVRVNSLRNKLQTETEAARADEHVKFEKRRNELEMLMKERELEMKGQYDELMAVARAAKREQSEKLAEVEAELKNARRAVEKAEEEYSKYSEMKNAFKERSNEYAVKLAEIANLDVEKIHSEAKEQIERKCIEDLAMYRAEIVSKAKAQVDDEARKMLSLAMQRMAPEMPQGISTFTVRIPSEAVKGKLIGKDGRNIRSFESATGTSLIIDETPDSVMVSSFNPMRRAIAKTALEALIADGRINPATIETAVEEAGKNITQSLFDAGQNAVESLGLARVHHDVISILGKLDFHLSLNQNTLRHSVEVANLCALIAVELDADPFVAKRVGLFHDIGKVISSLEVSHAKAGAELLERCGESDIVVNAVASHHGEVEAKSIYSSILQMADSLSATRPGARMEATDGYIRRIKTLESVAKSFEGVSNAYVIQAGRELRVTVSPEMIGDLEARDIASKVRQKIEESTDSSIPIKITIIRESRWTEIVKPKNHNV